MNLPWKDSCLSLTFQLKLKYYDNLFEYLKNLQIYFYTKIRGEINGKPI